jgi:hypothetical protein
MAFKITVNAADLTSQIDSLQQTSIERPLNGRASARFTFMGSQLDGPVDRFDEVVMYARDGATPIFGGVVLKRTARGAIPGSLLTRLDVECVGFAAYTDWCSTSLSYTVPVTLIDVLTDLIADPLINYGITLDAGQVTGPTLDPFSWSNKRVSDALRELMDRATGVSGDGYVYTIDPSKALKAFVAGTDAAPYTIADYAPAYCRDVVVTDTDRIPANYIILTCGPAGTESVTQFWTADGIASTWTADIAAAVGSVPPPTVKVNAVTKTVGPGGDYTWDPATYTLTLGTASLPSAGHVIELVYTAQFPFTVTATSGSSPVIEYQQTDESIRSVAAGQEKADGLLVQMNQSPFELTATSIDYAGWDAGQLLSTDLSNSRFGLITPTPDFIITSVSVNLIKSEFWEYTIQATSSATYQGGYLDRWRELGVVAQ